MTNYARRTFAEGTSDLIPDGIGVDFTQWGRPVRTRPHQEHPIACQNYTRILYTREKNQWKLDEERQQDASMGFNIKESPKYDEEPTQATSIYPRNLKESIPDALKAPHYIP